MQIAPYLLTIAKYVAGVIILLVIFFAPAYLAQQTKKDKTNMTMIRLASWTLGWTIIGWLWALFWSSKK